MHVPDAAPSAADHDHPAVVPGHIRDHLSALIVTDHGAFRHTYDKILSVGTMAAPLCTGLTAFCHIFPDMPEISQCVQAVAHFKNNISALAAVAAVGTACRHKEFPAEADMSVSALA